MDRALQNVCVFVAALGVAAWLCLGVALPGLAEQAPQAQPTASRPPAAAWSADLPVVSDGRHVWLWANDQDPKDVSRRLLALYHTDANFEAPPEAPPETTSDSGTDSGADAGTSSGGASGGASGGGDGPAWEAVTTLTGRLAPHGAAAEHDTLWLIFDSGAVQKVTLERGTLKDQWFFSQAPALALPKHTTLRATTAAHGRLWALVRVESPEVLAAIDRGADRPSAPPPVTRRKRSDVQSQVLGLPPTPPVRTGDAAEAEEPAGVESKPQPQPQPQSDADAEPDAEPDAPPEPEPDAPAEAAVDLEPEGETQTQTQDPTSPPSTPQPKAPADRLLVLERGAWRNVGLPEGWQPDLLTHLLPPRHRGGQPQIFVQTSATHDGGRARLYRPGEDGWRVANLKLPTPGGAAPLLIGEQLLLVQHRPTHDGFAAQVLAVRGDQLTAIGSIAFDADDVFPRNGRWNAVDFDGAVGVLAGPRSVAADVLRRTQEPKADLPDPGPMLAVIDLQGQVTRGPAMMRVEPSHPWADAADRIIMLTVVITSTVLLLTFWRRDPTANNLDLPSDLVLGSIMRRVLAGVIDLAPGLLLGAKLFDVPLQEIYESWPGRGLGSTWEMMLPGVVAIGVVVAHTVAFELVLGGRSLGKLLTGLRVATLDGGKPRPWQTLLRCGLKACDLVAYLLLILPMISPHRQRLGDMVAKTIVVMKAPPPESESQEDADETTEGQ